MINPCGFLAIMPPKADQMLDDVGAIPFRPKGEKADEDAGVLIPAADDTGKTGKAAGKGDAI